MCFLSLSYSVLKHPDIRIPVPSLFHLGVSQNQKAPAVSSRFGWGDDAKRFAVSHPNVGNSDDLNLQMLGHEVNLARWLLSVSVIYIIIIYIYNTRVYIYIYLEQPHARIWAWMCLGFFFCLTLEFSPESKFLPERVFYIFAKDFCSLNCSKSFPRQFSPDSRVFPPDSRAFPPELVNTKTQK